MEKQTLTMTAMLSDHDDDQDQTDESDESSEDEEAFKPGDMIWGKHSRIWCPQMCSLNDVPSNLQHWFRV